MNWEELCREWEAMKGAVRAHWRNLSDDDLAAVEGDGAKLLETLQRCYGFTPGKAEEEVCAFERDVRRPGSVE